MFATDMTVPPLLITSKFAFVSHRGADKPRIRSFVNTAIERHIPLWIDRPEDLEIDVTNHQQWLGQIGKGTEWPTSIDEALFAAAAFVVFWSKAWQDHVGVLLREVAVAHARARLRQARYFPAFLDRVSDLPADVRAFREENHDVFQGYNVATPDSLDWQRLLDELAAATKHRPDDSAGGPADVSSAPIDWVAVLFDHGRPERVSLLLLRLPPGPAVDSLEISFGLRVLVANAVTGPAAAGLVATASASVLATFPASMRGARFSLIVMPASVPHPSQVAALSYWDSVFDTACHLGPRMLGALLLSLPPNVTHGRERELGELLNRLEHWER